MYIIKVNTSYMPIRLTKTEPVAIPTTVHNTPIKVSHGDHAETNSFKIHRTGAGQRKRTKNNKLISAASEPETAAAICTINLIISMIIKLAGLVFLSADDRC
ncbi:MAG TPA: hypothetical protein DIC22_07050 [Chitinophagaceae bacterium]|nr:hypothetical protein [Chitinophagaceae bacterium]